MNQEVYLTVKDETGRLFPLAALWPKKLQAAYQPEIDKFLKDSAKEGLTLAEVVLLELDNSPFGEGND